MKPFWVYILKCRDGSYYTGHTDDLEKRMAEHEAGSPGYTFSRRPLKMVFSDSFRSREEALSMERRIKGWCRAKKEALISGDWEELSLLAKSKSFRQ